MAWHRLAPESRFEPDRVVAFTCRRCGAHASRHAGGRCPARLAGALARLMGL